MHRPGNGRVDADPMAEVRDRPRVARLNGSTGVAPPPRRVQQLRGRGGRCESCRGGRGSDRDHHHLADAVPLEVLLLERPVELRAIERERDPAGVRPGEHRLEVRALPADPHVLRGARAPIDGQDEIERLVRGERLLDLLARQRHGGGVRTSPNVRGRGNEHRRCARPVSLHGGPPFLDSPRRKSGSASLDGGSGSDLPVFATIVSRLRARLKGR